MEEDKQDFSKWVIVTASNSVTYVGELESEDKQSVVVTIKSPLIMRIDKAQAGNTFALTPNTLLCERMTVEGVTVVHWADLDQSFAERLGTEAGRLTATLKSVKSSLFPAGQRA